MGAFGSTPNAIAGQVDILLAEVCPQTEDPERCLERLPAFWASLSVLIMPVHFSHICDDLEECPPPTGKVTRFSPATQLKLKFTFTLYLSFNTNKLSS